MRTPQHTRRGESLLQCVLIVTLISVALIITYTALSEGVHEVLSTLVTTF